MKEIVENGIKRLYGIYRATVVDVYDPLRQRRLKLRFQTSPDAPSSWVAPLDNSNILAEVPKIGQGVWVQFINGDPEYPVWIGHFGKNKDTKDYIYVKRWDESIPLDCDAYWLQFLNMPDGTRTFDLIESIRGISNELCELKSGLYNYFGSFYDTQDQTASVNTPTAMLLRTTDISNGISIVSNSRIKVANAGVYNIQFSAQLHNTGGGGSGNTVQIWLRKNGSNVADSNTKVSVQSNNPYVVASWNFYVSLNANDYVELMWQTDNANIIIEYEAAGSTPAIPSLITTVSKFTTV